MSTQSSMSPANPQTCGHERLLARYRNRSAQLESQPMGYKCQICLSEFLPADPVAVRFRARHAAEAAAG